MRIGIYVGSFNPPHIGHIKIPRYLLDKHIVDKVIIIPTGNYWDKNNLIDIKDRINMLKYYEDKNILIDTTHNNTSYTYELLDKLKEEYPNDNLYLIIGADNIINFDKWKKIDEILKYKIIVINRDNIDVYKYINKFKNKNNFIIINDFEKINISSTEIRKFIEENNLSKLDKYLDKEIINYILNHNLYK